MQIRNLWFALLVFTSLTGFGQEILIPYKSGEKFGLCDETAKVVVMPVYDKVEYLEQNYFVFGNKETRMDTVADWQGKYFVRLEEEWSVGLMKKDQILIPQQEFEDFVIYDHFIEVTQDKYQHENLYLYNLMGQKIDEERIFSFRYNDENYLGGLAESSDRFTFLSLYYGERSYGARFSIAVYDNELQNIDSWLVKDVTGYSYESNKSLNDLIFCTYADASGKVQEKYIRQVNGRFEIVDNRALTPEEKARLKEKEKSLLAEKTTDDGSGYEAVRADEPETGFYHEPLPPPDYEGYDIYKDSLVYIGNFGRKTVKREKNSEWIPFFL